MFSEKIHRNLYLFGVCSLAFGIMMGTVPTSVPQFILLGNWLIEGDFKQKWLRLKSNKLFWAIISIYLIHVVGLVYSQDIPEGLKDLRIKLPLLFLATLFFSTKPLNTNEFKILLYCFLIGSFTNTLWCIIYNFILHGNEVARNASRFMSHIRLGLYLNLTVAVCFYFIIESKKYLLKILFLALLGYFLFSMYALGLASGIVNLLLVSSVGLFFYLFKQTRLK